MGRDLLYGLVSCANDSAMFEVSHKVLRSVAGEIRSRKKQGLRGPVATEVMTLK